MHTFFVPGAEHHEVPLSEEEAGHALRVLRLKQGDRVRLVDGKGVRAEAELHIVGRHAANARIIERTRVPRERPCSVHLAVAPTKHIDRFEWLLEKATEIGVDRITPVITARTERQHLRPDRMEKVLIAAMKQSQRAWLPVLDAPLPLRDLYGHAATQRFFGWCEGEHAALMQVYTPTSDALVLIGPEGDFTAQEADELRNAGFRAVSLGGARLRTETAALAAVTWMSFASQAR